jgi:nickel transport protein
VSRAAALLISAAIALAPLAARGHEVRHQIERGRAIGVRAYFADDEPLAYTQYEVYSPADPKIPYQKGRTDRSGWAAFVPDVAGKWRVRVIDDTGHGLDVEIEAAPAAGAATQGVAPVSTVTSIFRPLVGVAIVVGVFGVLFALYRRKGKAS